MGCAQTDERHWKDVESSFRSDGFDTAQKVLIYHFELYPNCQHRALAEQHYVTGCRETVDNCVAYLKVFPAGRRKAEVEQLIWKGCDDPLSYLGIGNNVCSIYKDNFPNGHRADLERIFKKRQDHEREEKQEADRAEAQERDRFGKMSYFVVQYPPGFENRDAVVLSVDGSRIIPERENGPEKIAIPYGHFVEVCYTSFSGYTSNSECTRVLAQGDVLRVPLTKVTVSYPPQMTPMCTYSWPDPGSSKDAVWVWPGPQFVSCSFIGRFADHGAGAVGTSSTDEIKVAFEAPSEGGIAHISYFNTGALVEALSQVSPTWDEN